MKELIELLDRCLARDRSRYVDRARARLGRLRVAETTFSAEGVVHEAWIRLCGKIRAGSVRPTPTPEAIESLFAMTCEEVIVDVYRRQHARKRSALRRDHRDLALHDLVDARAVRPDEQAAAEDRCRWLLSLLGRGRTGAALRQVLILKHEGRSNREIASQLGLRDVKSVERKLQRIRAILRPSLDEHE